MQGWRISMEDAHAAVLDLHAKYVDNSGTQTSPDKRLSFFGVYDGHGGDKVALFAGENVHKIVAKQESFAKGDIEQALKDGFLATDRAILEGSLVQAPTSCGLLWRNVTNVVRPKIRGRSLRLYGFGRHHF
jgi:serine/threonine protein phosphatase PrpC